jgi:signal transduction histidine kinase/CheY-like chemotaxis protein
MKINTYPFKLGHNPAAFGIVLFIALLFIFILIGTFLTRYETQRKDLLLYDQTLQNLHDMREALASRIYLNIYKASAVKSLVAMNPDFTQEDFARSIAVQFNGDHDLRNIALARDMVIQFMYPMEGNEAALGLDYTTLPDQFEAAQKAIEINEIVLAGPVSLVQGGTGIIARTPVHYKDPSTGEEKFWGLSSVVMLIDSIIVKAGITQGYNDLRIAIRGKDALGADGDVFWGDESIFMHNPTVQTIELPYGSWQIGAIPEQGWASQTVYFSALLWSYYIAAFIVLSFTFIIISLTLTRKNTADALRIAEEQLAKTAYDLTENIPVGTYTMVQSPEGGVAKFGFMSRRFLEMTRLTRETAEDPSKVFASIHPDDYNEWVERNLKTFAEKTHFLGETRTLIDGEVRWVKAESYPRILADGTTVWEGVLIDITEEKLLKEQILTEKERAEAANIAKSQFLANMSHEIRTPLNGLLGFTELLKNTPLTPVQQQYVQNALVSGQTLLGIISDILDFSKIEAGMLELESVKTDITELLENTLDIVKYPAEEKGLELLLNVDPDVPQYAYVDPVRLKQILANLLGNAVKFTKSGEIELKLACSMLDNCEAALLFSIRDTGIGISEEQREKLFKAFSQADNSTTRKFGGTGLGLTISEMIAAKMGSKIHFKSSTDEGSTFYFDLTTRVEDGVKQEFSGFNHVKRCLIIDDNTRSQQLLERMLTGWGIECASDNNASNALSRLETSPSFDVILCDYRMPGTDGLETFRIMMEKLNLTPGKQHFILMHASSEDVVFFDNCKAVGIHHFVSKPIKAGELYHGLRKLQQSEEPPTEVPNNRDIDHFGLKFKDVNILIAEDVVMNTMLLKSILGRVIPRARIFEAVNGIEAVDLFKSSRPDLIFMDVQMPELDGIEATIQIRSLEKGSGIHTPIITLTAGVFKEEQEKCYAAGMDYFLTKPVDAMKIRELLEAIFGGSNADNANAARAASVMENLP